MSAHAYLPPSGAACWVACPRWPYMQLRFPDLSDPEPSEVGTLAHEVLRAAAVGEPEPAGATDEMRDGAALALAHLATLNLDRVDVEVRISGRVIHDSQNWGTPDLIGHRGTVVHVVDYKFGHGYVDAFENLQCVNYALLYAEKCGFESLPEVVVHIVQPCFYRAAPVRSWACSPRRLGELRDILRAAAREATVVDPEARTGSQCDHCTGRHACEALGRVTDRSVDLSWQAMPVESSWLAISNELRYLKAALTRLAARVSGYETQIKHRLSTGATDPNWTLTKTVGNAKWIIPPEDVVALFGSKMVKPGVITPTQALNAKLLTPEMFNAVTERKVGVAMVPSETLQRAADAAFSKEAS